MDNVFLKNLHGFDIYVQPDGKFTTALPTSVMTSHYLSEIETSINRLASTEAKNSTVEIITLQNSYSYRPLRYVVKSVSRRAYGIVAHMENGYVVRDGPFFEFDQELYTQMIEAEDFYQAEKNRLHVEHHEKHLEFKSRLKLITSDELIKACNKSIDLAVKKASKLTHSGQTRKIKAPEHPKQKRRGEAPP